MDIIAEERIRNFIQHVNQKRGTTVILTTHDLSDVEKLCKRVMIIDEGKLLYDGKSEDLKRRFGGQRQLIVEFGEEYENPSIEGSQLLKQDSKRVIYLFERNTITASELIGRISAKYRILDLEVREPEIETTIRRIYEERLLKQD